MSNVRATVLLDIDESDEERLKASAEQFLEQALVEKAPSEEVEDNAVRDKPVVKIEEVETGPEIVETDDVLGGKPRVEGARVSAQQIYEMHDERGMDPEEISEQLPSVEPEGAEAAIDYIENNGDGLEPDAWMYDWDKTDRVSPVKPELGKEWKEEVSDEKMWPLYSAETIAELAHRLWTYWSQHIAEEEDISEDRLERWEDLWIPYGALDEEDKQDDRRLVQKFLSEKPDYSFEIDTGAPK